MSNKVTVNKTTNEVSVSSAGTVGPQGGAGQISSATATATEVAVSNLGASGDPTVSVTLGGTEEIRTMAFAFGIPTGASAHSGAPLTIGEDDTGYDVTFFGDTAGSFLKWDASEDSLELTDSTPFKIGDDAAGDMTLYHNGTDSYITNKTGELKIATETSGIAVKIGHTTSETTVNDNLTVTGNLTVSGTTTTVDTTVTVSDAVVVNNAGSDVGVKVNSTSTGHVMQLQDNGTDIFVVNDGGKVAVGVSGNAASLLHLRGPSGADTDIRLEGTPGSADGDVANILAYHGSNNVGKIRFKRGADAADGEIEFFTANDTLNSAAMHIDQNSKVGINTVTPSTPLDVNGTATATAFAGPLTGNVTGNVPGNLTGNVTGNVTGDVTGDVTGNADTATALETARTIGGVSFNGTANINLPGVNATGDQDTSGNATTATTATNVTVADESTDTTCNILFVTGASGNLAPKSGSNLLFNSSSGIMTAGGFIGTLQGDCTGNATTATTASYLTITDESADTTCFPLFVTAATGSMLLPKTGTNLSFNSDTGVLTATGFAGPLTGDVTGTASAIANGIVSEAKMQISNAPTNGYALIARSGNTGGMTWEDLGTLFDTAGSAVSMAIALG